MKRIQLDITKINANKYIVGNKVMNYMELVEWFKNLVASDDDEE